MKKAFSIVASIILAVALAGCGGGSAPGTPTVGGKPGQPLDPQGNWLFTITAGSKTVKLAGQLYELTSPIVTSNEMGAVDPAGSLCFGHFGVSGQATGTNGITLTVQQTDAIGVNIALALTGTVAVDEAHMNGTWTLTGNSNSCIGTASGTWSAQLLAPVTGNWTGSVALGSNETLTVTASLTEVTDQTVANMGQVTGTITVNGSPCYEQTATFTVPPWGTSTAALGSHAGEVMALRPATNGASGVTVSGHVTPDGTTYNIDSFQVAGGACDSEQFTGTLTHN